jgi:hypothetical protein
VTLDEHDNKKWPHCTYNMLLLKAFQKLLKLVCFPLRKLVTIGTRATLPCWGDHDHLAVQQIHPLLYSIVGVLENVPELVGRIQVGCETASVKSANIL